MKEGEESSDTDESVPVPCEIGQVNWTSTQLEQEFESFVAAYKERLDSFDWTFDKKKRNEFGNGLYHSFIVWAVIRLLRPTTVVESGVYSGGTSWLIERATRDWNAKLVFIDPGEKGWSVKEHSPNRKVYDYRGNGRFLDFNELPWNEIEQDRSNALVFFDDHMDQLRRLKEARYHGFRHVMYDDNYVPGTGDAFSIKNACDQSGHIRWLFTDNGKVPNRCDRFGSSCTELSHSESIEAYNQLKTLAEVVWEGPPLTSILHPLGYIRPYFTKQQGEGPSRWIVGVHDRTVQAITKDPLFHSKEVLESALGLDLAMQQFEGSRYLHIVYIRLR